jgi:hypothetical protein
VSDKLLAEERKKERKKKKNNKKRSKHNMSPKLCLGDIISVHSSQKCISMAILRNLKDL